MYLASIGCLLGQFKSSLADGSLGVFSSPLFLTSGTSFFESRGVGGVKQTSSVPFLRGEACAREPLPTPRKKGGTKVIL